MKKAVAMVLAVIMILSLGGTAFAQGGTLVERAKQAALDYAGVKASEATFTKVHREWEDGRQIYEIEFYVGDTEYDMDVDVNTDRVTDFSTEYHGGYTQPAGDDFGYCYDDDMYDCDDMYDWDD